MSRGLGKEAYQIRAVVVTLFRLGLQRLGREEGMYGSATMRATKDPNIAFYFGDRVQWEDESACRQGAFKPWNRSMYARFLALDLRDKPIRRW
ncbi:hypothetical protein HPP92_017250 [Vanilla planifolia]|uniref:Uncharacterized protein n=1 Tax=Vanilla planifolia TaxID=51239 RepID=A0A835QHN8_VANPL|nr:hypothetical protein HPP92_017250 [Vanilla planifolia]